MFGLDAAEDLVCDADVDSDSIGVFGLRLYALRLPVCTIVVVG